MKSICLPLSARRPALPAPPAAAGHASLFPHYPLTISLDLHTPKCPLNTLIEIK